MNRVNIMEMKFFLNVISESNEIIIYGAGVVCKEFVSYLDNNIKSKIKHIVVTSKEGNDNFINGISVVAIDEFSGEKDVPIIVAVKETFVQEIKSLLNQKGLHNIFVVTNSNLMIYKACLKLRNKERFLKHIKCDVQITSNERLYENALNLGKFISSVNKESMSFSSLTFTWGGSGILDYALLRGLILKYNLKTYLEIGTYIGDSLKAVSDLLKTCYSISVPETHPAHMKNWCKARHIKDYTNKLVNEDNMVQFLSDSKEFDFSSIDENIDIYFIDGDHSYEGVFIDSIKVFDHFDSENNFVVWHDCRAAIGINEEVINAIRDAIGEYFENFYIFDNCMCGIYIPHKYINDFAKIEATDELTTYRVTLSKN